MEQNVVLIDCESLDSSDPHGYYSSCLKSESNFKSPTKRSFLNECIRQIYILNGKGNVLPQTPSPIVYNKGQIWNTLNYLIQPSRLTSKRASIDRIKRQLFRENRQNNRKPPNPQKVKHYRVSRVIMEKFALI